MEMLRPLVMYRAGLEDLKPRYINVNERRPG